MPDQMGRCAPEWETAKKAFETKTNAKKPTKKFLGVRRGTGIDAALKKMDKLYGNAVKEADPKARLKLLVGYGKALEGFSKQRKAYKKVLRDAAAEEQEKSELLKQIDVLTKRLSATEAGARDNLNTQILSAQDQVKKGASSETPSKEEKARALAETQMKKMIPSLKSAVKNAALFVAQVKADPKPEVFNDGIKNAARKITQNVGWVGKIKQTLGKDLGVSVDLAGRIVKVMEPWAAEKRKVQADADQKAVLRELGAFAQMVQGSNQLLKEMQKASR